MYIRCKHRNVAKDLSRLASPHLAYLSIYIYLPIYLGDPKQKHVNSMNPLNPLGSNASEKPS